MINRFFSWFMKDGLATVSKELGRAYANKLMAKNDQERIDADKEIAYLHIQQKLLIAEQKSYITRWIRPAFAFPFIVYDCKVIIWDKVLGWGITDSLSPDFWRLQMIVFGAYFLTRPLERY